jgi:DNA-binding NtrC family response regulator
MSSLRDSTIVIVDDDEDSADLLCELLQQRGYRAIAFASARPCLEYLRGRNVDVVVTDVQMPGMTGIELCSELHVQHPDLLTIVLTGIADLGPAIRAGAYDVIRKPVKLALLEIAIKRALEHLALRRVLGRPRVDPATPIEVSPLPEAFAKLEPARLDVATCAANPDRDRWSLYRRQDDRDSASASPGDNDE